MHPKDLCACGHRRSMHKGEDGPCRHRHPTPCNAFQLEEAHIVLSAEAMALLQGLVETSEPLTHYRTEIVEELYDHEFIEYIKVQRWIKITAKGRDYARDNGDTA